MPKAVVSELLSLTRILAPLATVLASLPTLLKWWKANRRDGRAEELRRRITVLNQFIATAPALGETLEAKAALRTSVEERDALLHQLGVLTAVAAASSELKPALQAAAPQHSSSTTARPSVWRRILLLYPPSSVLGWVFRILVYLSVLVIVSVSFQWDQDAPVALAVWAGLLVLFFWLTDVTEHGGRRAQELPIQNQRPRSRPQRIFLWYWPERNAARILHIAIYLIAFLLVAGIAGITADDEWDSDGVLGVSVIAAVDALLYFAARRMDRTNAGLAAKAAEANVAIPPPISQQG